MFRRLLVAFDGSAHSQRALDEAIELAQANHGSVTVMTVAPEPSRLWSVGLGYGDPLNFDGLGYQVERGTRPCSTALQTVPADVPVTAILKRGAASRSRRARPTAPCSRLRHAEADVALTAGRPAAHRWVGG